MLDTLVVNTFPTVMEIRELRTLRTLASTGSITRVAAHVHLTPAAVHKQLRGLGSELGGPLYRRIGQELQLTELGSLVLRLSEPLLALHEEVLVGIDAWKERKKGFIRIGIGPAAGTYLFGPLLRRCHRLLPQVEFVVESGFTSSLLRDVTAGSLDLALVPFSQQDESAFSVEVAWDVEFVLVHKMRNVPQRCALHELKKFPFILFQSGSRTQDAIDRYFGEVDLDPLVSMRFDNSEAIKNMIRRGEGLGMLPLSSVSEDLRKGTLSTVRLRDVPFVSRLALLGRKSNAVTASVVTFVKIMRGFKWQGLHLTHQTPEKSPIPFSLAANAKGHR